MELQEKVSGIQTLVEFNKILNQNPDSAWLRVNRFADNARYLPISYVEQLLDEVYSGLWKTDNFTYKLIENEIVGSLQLSVFHPIAQVWITRNGSAGQPVRKNKDTGKKITNTLVMDFPHLKAACITNAAKGLGRLFGRDLNREHTATETGGSIIERSNKLALLERAYKKIDSDKTIRDKEKARNKINHVSVKRLNKYLDNE